MTDDELFAAVESAMAQSRAVMDEAAAALRAAHLANAALKAEVVWLRQVAANRAEIQDYEQERAWHIRRDERNGRHTP